MSNEKSPPETRVSLRISGGALIFCSVAAFFFGAKMLLPMAIAAAVHELGHLLVLLLQDCTPESLRIDASGLLITYRGGRGGFSGFLRAFAGPAAGLIFAAALFGSPVQLLRDCARLSLVFSLGNLLPFSAMDGGTMLACLTEGLRKKGPDLHAVQIIDASVALLVLLLGLFFEAKLLLFAFWLVLCILRAKRRD